MIVAGQLASLDLKEAADLLGLHPATLQARAKAGIIPGYKIGKPWRFLASDLEAYMRSHSKEEKPCRSTSAAASGGSVYRSAEEELDALLEQPTVKKPNGNTTNLRLVSGKNAKAARRSTTR